MNSVNKNFDSEWSQSVDTKWKPSEGLFSNGSAKKIAKEVFYGHKKDLKSSMASINFYLNRGGKGLSSDRKKVIEKSKDELRKLAGTKNFSYYVRKSFSKLGV